MLPYFTAAYGNAASGHAAGQDAAEAVEAARAAVADLIGVRRGDIVFTGGATESNNLAIFGVARAHQNNHGARRRIVTTAVEHKAVLEPCRWLQRCGWDVVILPVDAAGTVDVRAATEAINGDTLIVSIQAASNEIGTIQPVAQIAALAHEHGAFVHCDAAQAAGKIPLDVAGWDVDLLSISAHKLYGPKGVGALYVKGGPRRFPIAPLCAGGGQEGALRPGTLNVPGLVGFGEACRICREIGPHEAARIAALRDAFETALRAAVTGLRVNGAPGHRLPGNSSLTFPRIAADALLTHLPHIAISTGAACISGSIEPSHVLLALGLSREQALATIRVGLGRGTTAEEVERAAHDIAHAAHHIARLQT